jgi:hypothetical protein
MNRLYQTSKFFDQSIERDHIFQVLFHDMNLDLDVHKQQDLFDFCSGDVAYIDLADTIFLSWKLNLSDASIYDISKVFISHLEESNLFTSKELDSIKKMLSIFINDSTLKIQSYREELLNSVLYLMDIDNETMH